MGAAISLVETELARDSLAAVLNSTTYVTWALGP
jgi:hypothetical protein